MTNGSSLVKPPGEDRTPQARPTGDVFQVPGSPSPQPSPSGGRTRSRPANCQDAWEGRACGHHGSLSLRERVGVRGNRACPKRGSWATLGALGLRESGGRAEGLSR